MTAEIDIEQDRYGIADLPRKGGLYIDIGAHIGTWLVAALVDDPEAFAIAVEPLTDNCQAIYRNADENGVRDRITVYRAVFGTTVGHIPWNFRSKMDPEAAAMHRYIGGFNLDLMPEDVQYDTADVRFRSPAELLVNTDDVAVLKVAGETSEQALIGADLKRVKLIVGKYHSDLPKLVPWLLETHHVETYADKDQPLSDSFGWYHAVLRS